MSTPSPLRYVRIILLVFFALSAIGTAAQTVYQSGREPVEDVQDYQSAEGLWAAQAPDGVVAHVEDGILVITLKNGGSYFVPNSKDMALGQLAWSQEEFDLRAHVIRDYLGDNLFLLNEQADFDNMNWEKAGIHPYGLYWGYQDPSNYHVVMIRGLLYSVGRVEEGQWYGSDWALPIPPENLEKMADVADPDQIQELLLAQAAKNEVDLLDFYVRLSIQAAGAAFEEGDLDSDQLMERLQYTEDEIFQLNLALQSQNIHMFGDPNLIRVHQEEGTLSISINDIEVYRSSESADRSTLGLYGVMMGQPGTIKIDRFAARLPGQPADLEKGLEAWEAGEAHKALLHFLPLAQQGGSAEAQVRMASMYAEGIGVARDLAKTEEFLRMAAEQGDPMGQYMLGNFLSNAPPEFADEVEARRWFELAATEPGNIGKEAAFSLGGLVGDGRGGPQDYAKAVEWFERATIPPDPHPMALYSLGQIYYHGLTGEKDFLKAHDMFLASLRGGVTLAAVNLGSIYGEGLGRDLDYQESYKWFWIGFEGLPPGLQKDEVQGFLDYLATVLTPEQIKAAEQAGLDWIREWLVENDQ